MHGGKKFFGAAAFAAALTAGVTLMTVRTSGAHCDTMDGPVVHDARLALDQGELTPVLKWVRPDAEKEIRQAFQKTLVVRGQSPQAHELADTWFFETLVRVHRSGEGAPYTGVKPAGTPVDPGIAAADHAMESGSVDPLVRDLTAELSRALQERYARALSAQKNAGTGVEAGREYVEAYVQFMHFVERLHQTLSGAAEHGETGGDTELHGRTDTNAD